MHSIFFGLCPPHQVKCLSSSAALFWAWWRPLASPSSHFSAVRCEFGCIFQFLRQISLHTPPLILSHKIAPLPYLPVKELIKSHPSQSCQHLGTLRKGNAYLDFFIQSLLLMKWLWELHFFVFRNRSSDVEISTIMSVQRQVNGRKICECLPSVLGTFQELWVNQNYRPGHLSKLLWQYNQPKTIFWRMPRQREFVLAKCVICNYIILICVAVSCVYVISVRALHLFIKLSVM